MMGLFARILLVPLAVLALVGLGVIWVMLWTGSRLLGDQPEISR